MDRLYHFALAILDKLVPRKKQPNYSDLIVVKIDGIGDYFLFRNFLQVLAESKKFSGKKITLICNENVQEISKVLDGCYVSNHLAIDRVKFKSNIFYRWKKLAALKTLSSEYLVNAHHSRGFYCSDWVSKIIDANCKVAPRGDLANITARHKSISDRWYSSLIDLEEKFIFEFEKNIDFFSQVLNKKIELKKPELMIGRNKDHTLDLLISIGAGAKERVYSVDKMINILKIILSERSVRVGIVTDQLTRSDQNKLKDFCRKYGVDDYVNNLKLAELLAIIGKSKIVVSSDTSIQHIAVALDVPEIIVLSNGNYHGRFCPYPKDMHRGYSLLLHPKFDQCAQNIFNKASSLQVKEIDETIILNKLKKVFSKNNAI